MMLHGPRTKVLWLGGIPSPEWATECSIRHLHLEVVTGDLNPQQLATGKGVIVAVDQGSVDSLLSDAVRVLLSEATLHGLPGFVSCTVDDATEVAATLQRSRLRPTIEIMIRGKELGAIEAIARCKHEPPANAGLKLQGDDQLSREERILLRRAFTDCTSVKLVKQTTGTAKVFCAFATLEHSRAGPIPLPFFVKFDKAHRIRLELKNYQECTTLHIPFNQRPNLDINRCLIGQPIGIIVGNFVEQSESLQEVVDRGAGRSALHSLFEGALRGWRRQAFYDARYTREANILVGMDRARPSTYVLRRQDRLLKRQRQLGPSSKSFEQLEGMMASQPPISFRSGVIHGDLHGNNVRVTGNDAILIDFASIADGALTADPAALDVSLFLDTKTVKGNDWVELADASFAIDALIGSTPPPRPEHAAANLLEAIHYVRQMAANVTLTPYEYPLVVALQLIRKSSYSGQDEEQEQRRYHAYRLADRIVSDVSERLSRQSAA